MLPILQMSYRTVLVMCLQIATTSAAPVQPVIIQAQPQVMMHTLQQPSPIETLQSIKAQKINQQVNRPFQWQRPIMMPMLQQQTQTEILQELAKIQSMQHMMPIISEMQPPLLTSTILNQMPLEKLQPIQYQQYPMDEQQAMIQFRNQMSEDAMQEIAVQQQMLALQQLQVIKQITSAQSSFEFYQPQPVLILLPEEKTEGAEHTLLKNSHNNKEHKQDQAYENDELDSVTIEGVKEENPEYEKTPQQGTGIRKAVLLIPNARFSIGGIVSQIPWLPIEINVPDTAIWAWNGIYNGISNIISAIGGALPSRKRPENGTAEPSVKMFLKQLQKNNYEYNPMLPVYAVPLDEVIPVHFH